MYLEVYYFINMIHIINLILAAIKKLKVKEKKEILKSMSTIEK